MTHGKHTCKILKEIRRQIAEANGIEFATSECSYKGDASAHAQSAKPKCATLSSSSAPDCAWAKPWPSPASRRG